MADSTEPATDVTRRAMNLLLATVIGVAVVGFLVGIDYGVPRHEAKPPEPTGVVESEAGRPALPAMTYEQIGNASVGPTSRSAQSLDRFLQSPDPQAAAPVDPRLKRESLEARSQRRAYNGAPPVIPHAANQLSNDTCLVCHGQGFRLENRAARQLPHPYLENCMQCHAPPAPAIFEPGDPADNSFQGVAAPFEGERAWPGAPPVIPHSTWMREDCLACHGQQGWAGMQTTHANRQNCLQCHAPSSKLELQPPTLLQNELLPPPPISRE